MDEVEKARLRLALVSAAFALFVFCVIFGICKIYQRFNSAPAPVENNVQTSVAEPQLKSRSVKKSIPVKNIETIEKTAEKTVENSVFFDRSKIFYGILPAWKKYRPPRCGILADVTNKRILWSYRADKVVPIASMSKMLTLYLAFDMMQKSGNVITLKNNVKLVKNSAMGREGSFGFKAGDICMLEDLMKASTIRSSNDAAAAIAAYFGGTEKNFVAQMNSEALKIGMKNTRFINSHGLPEKNKDNLSTMNDMLLLSVRMLDIPDYMRFAKMNGAKIGGRTIVNTNNLMRLRKYPGVDGLKTGYTRRAGFCLAFSCIRNGRRLVGVTAGFPSAADRENFITALLNWAYR